ncbi:MAG: efflux RND transporter permease subunit [Porphyromonadaceae bacterium]|nr:efflux RND transporter permease subunit [Porphyromonadaceae bacterium]
MIKFLLRHPIAVIMTFTACIILGVVTYFTLPVSLLPHINIPYITIQVSGDNTSARELENTVIAPIRRQLMQISGLKGLESKTQDGSGIIRLEFEYGTDIDLAFIEVNERIDATMSSLPRSITRPRAIKSSATDIPVFYLNLTLKSDHPYEETDEPRFLELCTVAENVIKRRIEQLPQVAMVDVTGIPGRIIQLVPDMDKMQLVGLTISDIESVLAANNVEPGSMLVRDGYYEYNVQVSNTLRTVEDVKNIYITIGERVMQLHDFCDIHYASKKISGLSLVDGKRAVTLAIIKRDDENMSSLKEALKKTTDYFANRYPDIEFSITRNQTELLDYTISSLQQNLSLGLLFILVIALFSFRDFRSPLIIAVNIVVSVVITFLLFYLCHISLNIISLSGLILAVGMMIDNSIIVTENISQYRERGYTLFRACAIGATEMVTPMLSSMLTTIAVFLPLIFMSGIAGALFHDQAFSITIGLLCSYLVAILLLPILYFLFYRIGIRNKKDTLHLSTHKLSGGGRLERVYDKGINWIFSHKVCCTVIVMMTLPLCILMFYAIDKAKMPKMPQHELIARLDWNENIHIQENNHRIIEMLRMSNPYVMEHTAYVGTQDYILDNGSNMSGTEAELYFRAQTPIEIDSLKYLLRTYLQDYYPKAIVTFSPPENIFEKIFNTNEADVVAQVYPLHQHIVQEGIEQLEQLIGNACGEGIESIPMQRQLHLIIDKEKLLIYQVKYDDVVKALRSALKNNQVSVLRSYQQYIPICIVGIEPTISQILQNTHIVSSYDSGDESKSSIIRYIPLSELVKIEYASDLKQISSGRDGEYLPFRFYDVKEPPQLVSQIKESLIGNKDWDISFSGSFFSNERLMRELINILLVSILLMYFILCAQFESFLQPLIVLVEIPVDIAFALVGLWIFGHSLNLMSSIGIIVTCGIVVNDSILKIDAMNNLRKTGMSLIEAIHLAGHRRLRPIIMTSLTTILVMIPLLFSSDMASNLQKPLAVAMISAMIMGTLVSLFLVPMIYWTIYRKK